MALLDRFLFNKKKDNDTIASTTSTVNKKKKRFSLKQLYQKKQYKKEEHVTVLENQELLTQCIETALSNKRWSVADTTSLGFTDMQPKEPRPRKLSLPPQYSNIGYLASIPEVDSFTEK